MSGQGMLVDSHCHLDALTPEELEGVVSRAAAAGVGEMVCISTRLSQTETLVGLAESRAELWCTIGIHPHHAGEEGPVPEVGHLAQLAAHPRVIGIGESGLDYFYEHAPRDVQAESFRAHIRAARMAGVPLVIHARDADEDVAAILREEVGAGQGRAADGFGFVLHCFSSGAGLAEAGLALGGYIGVSGMMTFPRSVALREILRDVPAERLLVETDSPFLAPVPHRGRRNEPAWVADTARALAALRGVAPEEIAATTTRNFRTLFRKAA
ncbi:MAG: TatD family hydrolase [Janthinobacterium lividum]